MREVDHELAALRARVRELEIELRVRTHKPGFPERPEAFRGPSGAFDSGFAAGWFNHPFHDPYTRSDCSRAYIAGFQQGNREAEAEINRIISEEPKYQ